MQRNHAHAPPSHHHSPPPLANRHRYQQEPKSPVRVRHQYLYEQEPAAVAGPSRHDTKSRGTRVKSSSWVFPSGEDDDQGDYYDNECDWFTFDIMWRLEHYITE